MICFEAQEKIIDLVLGELTPEDEIMLKEHVNQCSICREEFEFLSECLQVCSHVETEACECQFQESYWNEFVIAVHDKVSQEKPRRTFPFRIVIPIAASAMVAMAITYYFFLRPAPQKPPTPAPSNYGRDPYEEVQELSPEETDQLLKMINEQYGGK